jgi:orotate phosphoribosyltransferase
MDLKYLIKILKKTNVELHTLSSYDMLLKQALSTNYITDSDFQTIKKWKKDPENW